MTTNRQNAQRYAAYRAAQECFDKVYEYVQEKLDSSQFSWRGSWKYPEEQSLEMGVRDGRLTLQEPLISFELLEQFNKKKGVYGLIVTNISPELLHRVIVPELKRIVDDCNMEINMVEEPYPDNRERRSATIVFVLADTRWPL